HRKYGVTTEDYVAFRDAMSVILLRRLAERRTPEIDTLVRLLVRATTELMNAGARRESAPAYIEGTVVEHIRLTRDQAVVRLQADAPVPYHAGQYLSVRTAAGEWRSLSPTIPPNPGGQMEFHVRAVAGRTARGPVGPRTRVEGRRRVVHATRAPV